MIFFTFPRVNDEAQLSGYNSVTSTTSEERPIVTIVALKTDFPTGGRHDGKAGQAVINRMAGFFETMIAL